MSDRLSAPGLSCAWHQGRLAPESIHDHAWPSEQLFNRDRQLAYPLTGRVIDGIRICAGTMRAGSSPRRSSRNARSSSASCARSTSRFFTWLNLAAALLRRLTKQRPKVTAATGRKSLCDPAGEACGHGIPPA